MFQIAQKWRFYDNNEQDHLGYPNFSLGYLWFVSLEMILFCHFTSVQK